jgi:transposase-like protein
MTPNAVWRQRNPEAVRAHWMVHNAIRRGQLKRQPCSNCGKAKAHAHHADYSRPFDITWLCSRCHRQLHAVTQGQETHPEGHWNPKDPVRPWHKKFQPATKRDQLLEQAQALRADGKPFSAIGQILGVSQGTVFKWLKPSPSYG